MSLDSGPVGNKGQPGIVSAALSGLCPRCNEPTLFDAPASIAFNCSGCGLDFRDYERGARFAGVVTILVAAILITLALAIETYLRPPLWLQALVWAPLTIGAVIGTLRVYKTALLYRRYGSRNDREENLE